MSDKTLAGLLQGLTNFTYDPTENLLTQTDAKSQALAFAFDTLNRLTTNNAGRP